MTEQQHPLTDEQHLDFLHQLITDISDEKISVASLSHKFGKPFAPRMGHRPEHSVLTIVLYHRHETPDEKLSRLIHATKNEELISTFVAVKELNELVESAQPVTDKQLPVNMKELRERWGLSANALKARAKALGVEILRPTGNSSYWPGDKIELGEQLHQWLQDGHPMNMFPAVLETQGNPRLTVHELARSLTIAASGKIADCDQKNDHEDDWQDHPSFSAKDRNPSLK